MLTCGDPLLLPATDASDELIPDHCVSADLHAKKPNLTLPRNLGAWPLTLLIFAVSLLHILSMRTARSKVYGHTQGQKDSLACSAASVCESLRAAMHCAHTSRPSMRMT